MDPLSNFGNVYYMIPFSSPRNYGKSKQVSAPKVARFVEISTLDLNHSPCLRFCMIRMIKKLKGKDGEIF
ncbi:Uncharacterized protein TCM_034557 [Theobroma cacao]|uniref:Uncharacterized protein n=1 Tax=Theobroma cacao TaxID=3641 RepID=A0A061FDW7_THECC|nr:Uncharacterized protein TCM_034557 [Theobroma cacao]